MPSGLARPEAILAICLPEPAPTDGDQSGLGAHPGAQMLAEPFDVVGGRTGEFDRLAERLVERQLLEDRHQRPHGVEHPAAGHAVDHAARRQHHRRRADQPAGLVHRHGRPGAEHPRLVAGARDDAAATETADEHGPPPQGGAGQLFDGREERVHVEVQDPAVHDCRCYADTLTRMAQPVRDVPIRDESIRLGQFLQARRSDRQRLGCQGGDRRGRGHASTATSKPAADASCTAVTPSTFGGQSARVTAAVSAAAHAFAIATRTPSPISAPRLRVAELEAGGQDLPGDQVAVGLRPLGAFGGHRRSRR